MNDCTKVLFKLIDMAGKFQASLIDPVWQFNEQGCHLTFQTIFGEILEYERSCELVKIIDTFAIDNHFSIRIVPGKVISISSTICDNYLNVHIKH